MPTTDDPAIRLVRQFLRRTADEETVERFDDALEEHGIYRALEEAAVGASLGIYVQRVMQRPGGEQARAPASEAPLVHEGELPEDEERAGLLLTVDVPHRELEAELTDGVLLLGAPAGVYEWRLDDTYDTMEWDTEDGDGVSRLHVMKEPLEVEAEFVDVDDDEDDP